MKFFSNMSEYYDYLARTDNPDNDIEYAALRDATDALVAFDLFVKRNIDAARQTQFAAGTNLEADFVRRAIRRR